MRSVSIFIDLRALQDVNYQYRGVGLYVASLMRGRKHTAAADGELIGLVDSDAEKLPAEYAVLADRIHGCWNWTIPPEGAIFVSPSPMTHDPTVTLKFTTHPRLLTATIIHDFIPLDWPGYLPRVSDGISYYSRLARLRQSHIFLPNSEFSAKRLREVLGVRQEFIRVTGAPIRCGLYAEAERVRKCWREPSNNPYFLSVGGGDRRKNTEVAVKAVWLLRSITGEAVKLKIVGHYDDDYRNDLLALASTGGSDPSFLEFCADVDDLALVRLYAGAIATIVPSHIEGFSMPVVEAAVCGSPVVASTCAAHLELLDQTEALFSSDSAGELTERLLAILRNSELRDRLVRLQNPLAAKFHEDAVATRFWDFISLHAHHRLGRAPATALRRARPRLAFVTPYPPNQTGVARFSELTLQALCQRAEIDLYTDAVRPLDMAEGVADAGAVSPALLRRGPYDSIVAVIGNSHFHSPMFEIMEKFGGPCILHDSRLTHFYHWRLGDRHFRNWATRLLGRPVSEDDVAGWLEDRNTGPLFVEPIIARAEPLIVHTRRLSELLRERYNIETSVTTFPPNFQFRDEALLPSSRAAARRRVAIPEGVFAIATFGYVALVKGITPLLVAGEILRSWKIPAELILVGASEHLRAPVEHIAREYGNASHVHLIGYVDAKRYEDYLLGVDAAVQLRTYDLGQASAALADCISAGVPTVSNESLADSCDAPYYVSRIHNHLSSLLLAEQLAEIWENRPRDSSGLQVERHRYCTEHSFDKYAEQLLNALGLQ
jgi:glycosyltransferase involved in cell wall biosynthesis